MFSELGSNLDDSSRAMFRETFLQEDIRDAESIAAFRNFSTHLYALIMEGIIFRAFSTPAEARAAELQAVAADLRYLAGHLKTIGCYYDDDEEHLISPRDKRWTRYAARLSKRLTTIVSAIETELKAGLEEEDDE
jgi:hypothetical protein